MTLTTEEIGDIIAAINAAFARVSAPSDEEMLHPQCMDEGDIVDFYGPVERDQLSDATLIGNYAALSFFSAKAFQYYLPAFMIWSLRNADTVEYTPESLLRTLDPQSSGPTLTDFAHSKFAHLTDSQATAVVRFLEAFEKVPDLADLATAALDNYWRDQTINRENVPR